MLNVTVDIVLGVGTYNRLVRQPGMASVKGSHGLRRIISQL